jgi:hypothetical protein
MFVKPGLKKRAEVGFKARVVNEEAKKIKRKERVERVTKDAASTWVVISRCCASMIGMLDK